MGNPNCGDDGYLGILMGNKGDKFSEDISKKDEENNENEPSVTIIKEPHLNRRYTFIVKNSLQTASWPPDEFITIEKSKKLPSNDSDLPESVVSVTSTEQLTHDESGLDEVCENNAKNKKKKRSFKCGAVCSIL